MVWALYVLFLANRYVFRRRRFEVKIWEWIRFEIFYLTGRCQHNGACCRSIMFVFDKTPLQTQHDFDKLVQKRPEYSRFTPRIEAGKIHCFDCTCLTPENRCSAYETRPKVCQDYPMGTMLAGRPLHVDCGYSVQLRPQAPLLSDPRFRQLIERQIANVGWIGLDR
jgi:hypothetical protein